MHREQLTNNEIQSDGLKRLVSLGDEFRHKLTHVIFKLDSFEADIVKGKIVHTWVLINNQRHVLKFVNRKEVARIFEDPNLISNRVENWLGDGI